MPYRLEYFDAPKDLSIKVYAELPDGYSEVKFGLGYKEADLNSEHWGEGKEFSMYYCSHCDGWIYGEPHKYHIDTLRPEQLAGRRGDEYFCRRCGERVGFWGTVS